jgi:hypothetical protein
VKIRDKEKHEEEEQRIEQAKKRGWKAEKEIRNMKKEEKKIEYERTQE